MIEECHDLMMSDIKNLDMLRCRLAKILKFTSRKDSDGNSIYWAKYVLDEGDDDECN